MVSNLPHCFVCSFREQRSLLLKCAATALSSKLIAHQKDFFSTMVVNAVSMLDELLPLNMIGIKKVQGGSLEVRTTGPVSNACVSLLQLEMVYVCSRSVPTCWVLLIYVCLFCSISHSLSARLRS